MIHRLIGLVVIAVVVIASLSYYLSPDDLKDCPQPDRKSTRLNSSHLR